MSAAASDRSNSPRESEQSYHSPEGSPKKEADHVEADKKSEEQSPAAGDRSQSPPSTANSPSPATSPIRSASQTAGTRTNNGDASEPDLPTDAEITYACIKRNDLDGFQRVVGYVPPQDGDDASDPLHQMPEDEAAVESILSAPLYPKDGLMSGNNAVFFAAYLNRRDFLEYLSKFKCFHDRLVRPVMLLMLSFQRYAMVFFLAANLAPELLTDSHGESGDTLLHILCHRSKTPVAFLEELLATVKRTSPPLGAFVNIQNAQGDTALHVVGRLSKGKEGGNAAKLLILAGAREDVENIKGQTPRAVATNPFVRDLMGIGKGPKPRPIPEVDEATKAEIDKFNDSSQFPALKPIDVPPVDPQLQLVASPFMTEEARENVQPKRKKVKKINQEEAENLVHRLSTQAIERKERWMQSKLSTIQEADKSRSKILSGDECEATTRRLHDEELETREGRKAATVDKFLKPPPTGPVLTAEDLEESMARLGGKKASDQAKQKKAELEEKYSPKKEKKRLTKEEQAASAARLHDESEGHAKETHSKSFNKYCIAEPTRFGGQNKLKKKDQLAMADRLSKPIVHQIS